MSERDPHTHGPLINNNSKEATQCKEVTHYKKIYLFNKWCGPLDIHMEGKKYDLVSPYCL